jgi:hypothetical protein
MSKQLQHFSWYERCGVPEFHAAFGARISEDPRQTQPGVAGDVWDDKAIVNKI